MSAARDRQRRRAAAGRLFEERCGAPRLQLSHLGRRQGAHALLLRHRSRDAVADAACEPRRQDRAQRHQHGAGRPGKDRDGVELDRRLRRRQHDLDLGQRAFPRHQHGARLPQRRGDPHPHQFRRELPLRGRHPEGRAAGDVLVPPARPRHLVGGGDGRRVRRDRGGRHRERSSPRWSGLPQRILVIRDLAVASSGPAIGTTHPVVEPFWDISTNYVPVEYPVETPAVLKMHAGEKEFWRVVNASANSILDIQIKYDRCSSRFRSWPSTACPPARRTASIKARSSPRTTSSSRPPAAPSSSSPRRTPR